MRFSKSDAGPFGMLKEVFLAHFEPVVTPLGPWKIPNALKISRFGNKSGSKMGPKGVFPKVMLDHLGCSNQ